jgi:PAS domain S-box-containing protein
MRLLIVDDHEVVRQGVRSLLSDHTNWDVCGEAVDGQDAVDKARELKPDLIVMDVSMPRLNGLEATRQVRSILPDCEVLILSQHESSEMARQALKVGARGYVVKTSSSRDLISAVAKASRREYFFDPAILDQTSTAHTDIQEILQRSAAFEQALRHSEQLYRSTFELAAVGVAHVSPEGKWLRVNKKLCEIVGYSEQELLRLTFQDITHPDDVAADIAEAERVRNGTLQTYSMEKRYIRKDRSIVWINLTVSALRDSNGKLEHFISVVEDINERKNAEEALSHSRKQLVLALRSSKSAMFDWDVVAGRGKWNSEMRALYDFEPKEENISAEEWMGLFHPDDRVRLAEEADRMWRDRSKQGFTFEFRTAPRDGETRWINSHGQIVRDAEGNAIRMIGIHTDVTDRRVAEQSLRERETELNEAQRLARIGSWHWIPKTDTVTWSEELYRIAGRDPKSSAVRYQDHHTLYTPESWSRLQEAVNETLKNGTGYSVELELLRPDGTKRRVIANGEAQRDSNGAIVSLRGTVQDISDRKLTEEATALLAAIVASSDDAVVSKTLDGIITSWNKSAERIFGYSAAEAVGQHITLIVPPDRHSEEDDILAQLRRGERIDHFETVRRRKDGRLIDVSVTISPVRDSSGRITGASKVARDITAQKDAAEKVRLAHETVRLMQAQDEERRRIARDFHDSAGQTLAVLGLSLAELVRKAERVAPDLVQLGKEIEVLVQQLHREIRTTSYLLHPPLLDEAGLCSALSCYVQGVAERSGMEIDLKISEALGRLSADMELAIFRMVQECLTNIHRHAESKTARIRIACDKGNVCVEVRDEGKGISPERLTEIESGGSGVGIAGIRERLRQFGGTLKIESDQTGTRVLASIPLAKFAPLPAIV